MMNRLSLKCLLLFIVLASGQVVQAAEHVTYYVNDALGSPILAMDEQGAVVWQESYQPYGQRQIKPAAANYDEQFYTGKQEEPDIGLQYFGARWYDPEAGRFTSIDPVGVQEGEIHSFNRYTYANNNPYKFVDPDGQKSVTLSGLKAALKEVHKRVGRLPKGEDGKWGSSQRGDSIKGYRFDKEGHPNAAPGTPDHDGLHINWWDYSQVKKSTAKKLGTEVNGAVRVMSEGLEKGLGSLIIGIEYIEENFPNTLSVLDAFDPISITQEIQNSERKIQYPPES